MNDFISQTDTSGNDTNPIDPKYLTFALGHEKYAIDIRNVTEIIGYQHITSVPDMPHYIRGVINLRGRIIPAIDARLRFAMTPRIYDSLTCIIILDYDAINIGLIVDSVLEVIDLHAESVVPPPKLGSQEGSQCIDALGRIGEDVVILLNVQRLLYSDLPLEVTAAVA